MTLVTRPDSSTVALGYDGAGRVATLAIARGTYQYAHDATSGNLTSITAPDGGLLTFAYDGSLLTDATWTGGVAGSMHWDYDNNFAVSAETVNCPTAVTLACSATAFSYDEDRLFVGAGDLVVSRDPQNGLLTGTSIGSLNDTWTYNSFAEPLSYVATYGGAELFNQQYTRDDVGRIAQKSETIAGVTSQYGYGYDAAGRLTDVTKDGVNVSHYTYDGNGNRLARTSPAGSEAGSYDAQDRLITYNATSYTYTAAGELSTRTDSNGTSAFTYDELGSPTHVTLANGAAIDYVLDGLNRRIGKKVNGTLVQQFVYSGSLSPSAEVDANGDVVTRFVYGTHPNVPDLIIKGDTEYRVITDHLGSPRLIVKVDDGSVAQRMDFDEFGNVITDSNPGFQPFGFAGGLYDADTTLVHFGARDYETHTGRWTAKDPFGFGGGDANVYAYASIDPINLTDESGLAVFVAVHPAVVGTDPEYHGGLVLQPDNPSDFANNPNFQQSGGRLATVGGQPFGTEWTWWFAPFGTLETKWNYHGDQPDNTSYLTPVSCPKGMTETQFIRNLMAAAGRYGNNRPYTIAPLPGTPYYNSNSYVAGVIIAAGGTPPALPVPTPGYGKPLPIP